MTDLEAVLLLALAYFGKYGIHAILGAFMAWMLHRETTR